MHLNESQKLLSVIYNLVSIRNQVLSNLSILHLCVGSQTSVISSVIHLPEDDHTRARKTKEAYCVYNIICSFIQGDQNVSVHLLSVV